MFSEPTSHEDTRPLLIALFAGMLAIANVAAVKVITFWGLSITAGVVPIAFAYLISDIAVERHGREFGHRLVWAGAASLVSVIVISQAVIALPGSSPVDDVLGASLPILLASVLTIIAAQHGDVALFAIIRDRLPYRATRNIGSTTVSQLLDTSLFSLLAFWILPQLIGGQLLAFDTIITIIATEWAIKTGIAIADTPLFLVATDQRV